MSSVGRDASDNPGMLNEGLVLVCVQNIVVDMLEQQFK